MIQGLFDTILPNINNSLKDGEFNPVTNKQETKIDWIRLLSSFVVFILLVLNFFGFVDIVTFMKILIHDLSSNLH